MHYEIKTFVSPKSESRFESHVPTLFIGLGGTGRDVLMRLRKQLYDRDGPRWPPYLRYLMLDLDMQEWWPRGESQEEYEPVRPRQGERIDCQISPEQFYQTFDLLEKQGDPRFVGWLKPRLQNLGAKSVLGGAGTHRQFGRLAFMLNYADIRAGIDRCLHEMLREVGRLAPQGAQGESIQQNTVDVVIVTSLAGGAGSGMLLDTAYLVQDIFRSHPLLSYLANRFVSLIAVMPSAFKQVTAHGTYRKLQQNAYAALLELEHHGTPRTSDDMFLGWTQNEERNLTGVGFVAPWKGNEFIEGQGWDACYLIDNVNPHTLHDPLKLSETCQMIADYLCLDSEQSQFAVQKRSNRHNLAQYKYDMICAWVRDAAIKENSDSRGDDDVVFATRNGCSFSSFGLSKISFNRERIYRAASYLLAARLVQERWLGSQGKYRNRDYQEWTREDFYGEAEDFSFHPDALLRHLYQAERGNWYQHALTDCDNMGNIPYAEASTRLRALRAKHLTLLQSSPDAGEAYQTLKENARLLVDTMRGLPALHKRLTQTVRNRANKIGITPTRELLKYYRAAAKSVPNTLARSAECGSNGMVRLQEADALPPPARRIAQRIEFKRACAAICEDILGGYRNKAEPLIEEDMERIVLYIGDEAYNEPPADLVSYGTLCGYFKRAEDQLRKLREQLERRFAECNQEHGSDRLQPLAPATWTAQHYSEQIDRCMLSNCDIGADESRSGFSWERFEEQFFYQLQTNGPSEFDRSVYSLTTLLDRWFERHMTSEEAITQISESLAASCGSLLARLKLNLDEYCDGSVIDILVNRCSHAERYSRLRRLVCTGTPYLLMNKYTDFVMTAGYMPRFDNLIGLREGEIPLISAENRAALLCSIESVSQQAGESMRPASVLPGERSSLVLCREVWGVPLQYYAYVDELHEAYAERREDVDECHINANASRGDLPDIRAIKPETYEQISHNAVTAVFSMIRGTISYRSDGAYVVRIPDFVGMNVCRLGKLISQVVRTVCEEESTRNYLQTAQEKWEREASPKEIALVYASALWTYYITRGGYHPGVELKLSPLRNCVQAIVRRLDRWLTANEEGRRWRDHLACTDWDSPEAVRRWHELYEILIHERVLVRASKAVPIWEVDWSKIGWLLLPQEAPSGTTAE